MINRLKRLIYRGSVRELSYYPRVNLPTVTLGTEYGSWTVCPVNLHAGSVVFSVGVGEDISADRALIDRFGVKVYGFDPTPASINWIRKTQVPEKFVFSGVGAAARDGMATFFAPRTSDFVSHSLIQTDVTGQATLQVPVRRVVTLMQDHNLTRIDLLKLDIEGAEYEVIEDVLSSGADVRQLVIEFHHKFAGVGLEKTKKAVSRLLESGYRIFYISEDTRDWGFIKLPVNDA